MARLVALILFSIFAIPHTYVLANSVENATTTRTQKAKCVEVLALETYDATKGLNIESKSVPLLKHFMKGTLFNGVRFEISGFEHGSSEGYYHLYFYNKFPHIRQNISGLEQIGITVKSEPNGIVIVSLPTSELLGKLIASNKALSSHLHIVLTDKYKISSDEFMRYLAAGKLIINSADYLHDVYDHLLGYVLFARTEDWGRAQQILKKTYKLIDTLKGKIPSYQIDLLQLVIYRIGNALERQTEEIGLDDSNQYFLKIKNEIDRAKYDLDHWMNEYQITQ